MYVGNAYLNLVTDNASSYEFDTKMTSTDVSVEKIETKSETEVETKDTIFINIKKVLVIGSGPIVIGQAAEFDYAGTQACRALKENGISVVLVNSNPATIMTDKEMADKVYLEPLKEEVIKNIIKIEKPDSILPTLGGQTGLNLAVALSESGFLKEHNVRLLGTNVETIKKLKTEKCLRTQCLKLANQLLIVLSLTMWMMLWTLQKKWSSDNHSSCLHFGWYRWWYC